MKNEKKIKYKSLTKKLVVYVLSGVSLVFIAITLLTYYFNKQMSHEQFSKRNEIVVNELQSLLIKPLKEKSILDLKTIVHSFLQDPSIVSLQLTNKHADILYEYENRKKDKKLIYQNDNEVIKFNIYLEEKPIGLAKIEFSEYIYLKDLYSMVIINILLLFTILLLIALIMFFVFKKVIKEPMDSFISSASEYSNGNYGHYVDIDFEEFRPLAKTFNEMALRIYLQIKELNNNKLNLEKKVQNRTHQLLKEKQFINSVMNSTNQLVITLDQGKVSSLNESFLKFFDLKDKNDFYKQLDKGFEGNSSQESLLNFFTLISYEKMFKDLYEKKFYKILLNKDTFSITTDDFIFDNKKIKTIALTNITELERIKNEIEEINKQTKDSIEYSSLIQKALIPSEDSFKNYFSDFLIYWKPKDIVGGDIYLFEKLRSEDEYLLFIIDCTGHGVPGALVTMLVKAIERQIISNLKQKNTEIHPSEVLKEFNIEMKHILKQKDAQIVNAGFDGAIVYINKKDRILRYSGAKMPLYYMQNNKLVKMKTNRCSVGYDSSDINYKFNEEELNFKEEMSFYLFSDGIMDQIGGEKGFPFGRKKLERLIENNSYLPMNEQKELILKALKEYQGNEEQNDDITLVAFKS